MTKFISYFIESLVGREGPSKKKKKMREGVGWGIIFFKLIKYIFFYNRLIKSFDIYHPNIITTSIILQNIPFYFFVFVLNKHRCSFKKKKINIDAVIFPCVRI